MTNSDIENNQTDCCFELEKILQAKKPLLIESCDSRPLKYRDNHQSDDVRTRTNLPLHYFEKPTIPLPCPRYPVSALSMC